MYEIQRNIFVDEVIFHSEYDFTYGSRKDELHHVLVELKKNW